MNFSFDSFRVTSSTGYTAFPETFTSIYNQLTECIM